MQVGVWKFVDPTVKHILWTKQFWKSDDIAFSMLIHIFFRKKLRIYFCQIYYAWSTASYLYLM